MRSLGREIGAWLVVAVAVTTVPPASADAVKEETVEVTGEAAIVGENLEAAKEKARKQALQLAVERVAGTFVTSISESKDWISVRDQVMAQSHGFVTGWEPVGRPVCERGTCKVTLKVRVAKGKLKDELDRFGLLIQQKRFPRVLLMVAEQNADAPKPTFWWNAEGETGGMRPQVFENALMRYLNMTYSPPPEPKEDAKKKGKKKKKDCSSPAKATAASCWKPLPDNLRFRFFDYTSLASHPLVSKFHSEKLSDKDLQKIGGLTDAEIIIYGTATATIPKKNLTAVMNYDSGFISSFGQASVRIIDIHTGQVLTSVSADARELAMSASQAGSRVLEALARKIAVSIQKGLADTWQAQSSGAWVRLEVRGLKSYGDLMKFKSLLKDGVSGISAVEQREWSDQTAKLEIQGSASAEDLAAALSAKKLGPFSIAVLGVRPGVLTVKLSK